MQSNNLQSKLFKHNGFSFDVYEQSYKIANIIELKIQLLFCTKIFTKKLTVKLTFYENCYIIELFMIFLFL